MKTEIDIPVRVEGFLPRDRKPRTEIVDLAVPVEIRNVARGAVGPAFRISGAGTALAPFARGMSEHMNVYDTVSFEGRVWMACGDVDRDGAPTAVGRHVRRMLRHAKGVRAGRRSLGLDDRSSFADPFGLSASEPRPGRREMPAFDHAISDPRESVAEFARAAASELMLCDGRLYVPGVVPVHRIAEDPSHAAQSVKRSVRSVWVAPWIEIYAPQAVPEVKTFFPDESYSLLTAIGSADTIMMRATPAIETVLPAHVETGFDRGRLTLRTATAMSALIREDREAAWVKRIGGDALHADMKDLVRRLLFRPFDGDAFAEKARPFLDALAAHVDRQDPLAALLAEALSSARRLDRAAGSRQGLREVALR